MISRRMVLGGLALGLVPGTVSAAAPRRLQLVPGKPPLRVTARVVTEPQARKHFEFTAEGLKGRIVLPTWYGGARLAGSVRVADRDLALLAIEGNTGTGVFQELAIIAGVDNAGSLRILGIETLSARDNMDCAFDQTFAGKLTARDGALLVVYQGSGTRGGGCGQGAPRSRRAPWRERWSLTIPWQGEGALPPVASSGKPGSVARRLDATRARVAAWAGETPRQTLDGDDMDRLQLYSTFEDA